MKSCEGFKFTKEHVWVSADGGKARVGISDYAQKKLKDIVYVDISSSLKEISEGKVFASIESVKNVSEIYAPVSGKVININTALFKTPELINQDAYENYLVEIEVADDSPLAALMSEKEYNEFCEGL